MVATANDLDIIDVVTINGWQAHTAVVHLTGENFIAKEVVTEDTAVRVSKVMRIGSGNIGQVTDQGMHRVVLLVDVIKMTRIIINSIGAEQVFQQQEAIVVLVLDTWSIVEDTHIRVNHFIVTDEEDGWDIDWLLGVSSWNVCLRWHRVECLLNLVNDLLVTHITCCNHNHILAIVIGCLEVLEVFDTDSGHVIAITLDRLSHHVLSESVEVRVLERHLFI